MSRRLSAVRPVDLARLGLGVAAVSQPEAFLRLTRARDGSGVRRTVRLLGARYVIQSGGGVALERPWLPEADAAVDLVHAASMVGFAAALPRHRRLALVSAAAALVFAAADLKEKVR